jgi:DinB superfamily
MIGRPTELETAPYHWRYIDQVLGDDPVLALEQQQAEALALFTGISEERSLGRYEAGKWSVREVLHHVNDAERVFGFRALWFARCFGGELAGFDQDVGVREAQSDRVMWSAHVEEFRRVREASIALFRNLPEEAWLRSGVASGKTVSVRALAFLCAGHAAHHLALVRERYLG